MRNFYFWIIFLIFSNSNCHSARYDPILKEVTKMQDFEYDARQALEQKYSLVDESIKNDNANNNIFSLLDQNLKIVQEIYDLVDKLQKGEMSGNDFLAYLLKERLHNFLCVRANLLERGASYVSYPPFDNELYTLWKNKFSLDHHSNEFNELTRQINIQRYQFFVLLIKKTFQILSLEELTPSTIKLLRASPSLWPILKNETLELGHHDQSGGYIKIKTYMDDFNTDFNLAIANILKGTPCRLWKKRKKSIDLGLYESHFLEKKKLIQFKGLGAPQKEETVILTDYQNGECDELPFPDFLKIKEEKPYIIEDSENFFNDFDFETFSDEVTTNNGESEIYEITSQERTEVVERLHKTDNAEFIQFVEPEKEDSCIEENNTNHSVEECSYKEDRYSYKKYHQKQEVNQFNKNKEKLISLDLDEDLDDFLEPNGLRKFHHLMPESHYKELSLKKKSQLFVDNIFNTKSFKTISYGDFKSFWIKMGGKIFEETGSSHKLLIGPKGESLFGIYAHGDGQKYTHRTIKYLRAALYYIGCRPNN